LSCQSLENLRDLRRSFPFGEDDLRHSDPNAPMMVHLGKAEVFKREMPHPGNRVVGRELAGADLIEELAESGGIHGSAKKVVTILSFS
jgi:hypothetical protein